MLLVSRPFRSRIDVSLRGGQNLEDIFNIFSSATIQFGPLTHFAPYSPSGIKTESSGSKKHSLFCWDVALSYGCAVHLSHLHVALDLSEVQAQVLTADGHQSAALSRAAKWRDLQDGHTLKSSMQRKDDGSS